MTTEERLLNVGWEKSSHFAELTIYERHAMRVLYNPRNDTIERYYYFKDFQTRILALKIPTALDLFNIFSPVPK